MGTVVVIGLVIFAVIAWRSPRHGVFIALATLPTYLIRFSIGSLPTTMLEVMIWILFVSVILRERQRHVILNAVKNLEILLRLRRIRMTGVWFPSALLLLAATISVFVSPDLRSALGAWKAYFVDPLLFVVVLLSIPPLGTRGPTAIPPLRIRGGEEGLDHSIRSNPPQPSLILREGVVNALAVCALFVSLAIIIQWLTRIGIPPPWDAEGRATGLFPYPNANGLLLAPIATLLVALVTLPKPLPSREGNLSLISLPWREGIKGRGVHLIIALLSLLAMVLTKSEAGLLAAAVGIAAAIFFPLPRRGKIKMGVLAVVAVAIVLLAAPNSKLITDKLLLRDWSGIVRRHTWSETVAMLRDRPILGAGLAGYPTVFAPYHTTRDAIEIFQYPHNIILNFWSETGLLGLFAILWLFLGVASVSLRSWRRERGLTSATPAAFALLTLLLHGLVDVPYFKNDLAILFWTLVTLTLPALDPNAQKTV